MLPPFPHQIAGCDFALNRHASLLAHEMGTGKTRTAIMAADQRGAKRVLVLCPTIAVGVWRDEFRKWTTVHRSMQLIRTGKDKPFATSPSITVCGFDLLSRSKILVDAMMKLRWDLIIIDEAHALKERTSKRTKAIYGPASRGNGIVSRGSQIVLLTGTPMLNHPAELWTHMKALVPAVLDKPNFSDFVERYCTVSTRWIGQRQIERITGAKRGEMPDLRNRLASFMHRVKKADVLRDLPPMTWQVWPITIMDCNSGAIPSTVSAFRAADEMAWSQFGRKSEEELLAFLKGSEHMATQRRLCGEVKVHGALKAIRAELEDGVGKVVVFAHHTSVIDALMKGLHDFGPICLDGRTPPKKRDTVVKSFQNDPDVRVFIGQNTAASTAITLTAASDVWIVEPDWTPAINAQAASRCHRAGQHDNVTVRMVALEGSIDQAIATILATKAAGIALLIEGEV